jgi:signal transduction histidine kinase
MARILIVEDESVATWYLEEALEIIGHQVVASVVSGEEAIQLAQETHPDLVLMDIRLQGEMDGIVAAEQIYSEFDIPVVYLTAHADDSTLSRAIITNPFGYLIKPFQEREVHTTIEMALHRYSREKDIKNANQQAVCEIQQRNLTLELSQVNLIARIQERTVQLQQALACIQILKRVFGRLKSLKSGGTQAQVLQSIIEELGRVLEADYCWVALYNPQHTLATISCQYIADAEWSINSVELDTRIEMARFPNFYQPLLDKACWLSPPPEVLPLPYQSVLTPESQFLISPLIDEESVVGEVGILNISQPIWSEIQADIISHLLNQCVVILRQAHTSPAASTYGEDLQLFNQLKDNFIDSISHELYTPLTNMRMAVEMLSSLTNSLKTTDIEADILQNRQQLWQKLEQYLQILREEWQREFDLVSDLLNFQSLETLTEPLPYSPIDLSQYLPRIIQSFCDQTVCHKQEFNYQIAAELPTLVSHEPSLTRIVTELLTNACKFSPPDSLITLTANIHGEALVIQVTNTGTAIPPEECDRIFQPFYRIPRPNLWNYSGTGLGLALVKKLVQLLGGEIHVQSQGEETTFTVTLFPGHPLFGCDSF